MSMSFDDVNDISIPTKETIVQLRKVFYSNEDNLIAAKEYASDLYTYYLEEDDSEQMLIKAKRELEYLHNKFPDDREIAEDYASCLSLWASSQSKSTIEKVSKELLIMLRKFPWSRNIAECYAEMLVCLAKNETSASKCYTYWCEIGHIRRCFSHNSRIKESYNTIEQINNHLREYILLSQRTQVYQEKYENASCLKNAITYAESLCKLADAEDDEIKCREYSETINSLVNQYPDCINLIESQAKVLYLAAESYDAMRKASFAIKMMLEQYPHNEMLAENYILSLDYLCEDEDDLDSLLSKIRKYHQLYPENTIIATSYARVLCASIDEQPIDEIKEKLDLIWYLFARNTKVDEIREIYCEAFCYYFDKLPEEDDSLLEFFPSYSEWLEKTIYLVDMNTGEAINEYNTIIDACLKTGKTPIDLLHSIEETTKSDNSSIWFVP